MSSSRARAAAIVGAAVVLLAIVASVAFAMGRQDKPANTVDDQAVTQDEPSAEDRCVDLWNRPDFSAKQRAASQAERGDVVVRVTFAKDFPDKCLLVVAATDVGSGFATFYREVGGEPGYEPYRMVDAGSVSQLADADKQWNARIGTDGSITPGYP